MKLSIVATLYKSAPYIAEFHQRAGAAARRLVGDDYEIILVNDGSPDDSLDLAVELSTSDSHVVVVDLSRNFGHHQAMMAGLAQAGGEKIFLIDSDLEEQPEWLLSFNDQLEEEKCNVVYGVQIKRKGSLFERWSGELYYSIMNMITGVRHPRNIVTARLMTLDYVRALLLHQEREIILSYIWLLTGFKQHEQRVEKLSLTPTTYTLKARLHLAVNAITSFSARPLETIFYFGLVVMVFSFATGLYYLVSKFLFASTLSGWTSLMVSLWFLGGTIVSVLGLIGIYISKIYSEVKQRPRAIVRKIYVKQ